MNTFLLLHCLLIASCGCADWLILPPAPRGVIGDGSARRTITFDNGVIEAFVARSPGASRATEPRVFVLQFTGGNAADAAAFVASRWQHRPVEVWIVNYPGYGDSSGPRTLKAMARVALLAFDELHRLARGRPIFLEGFSLGTVPALHVAAERQVDGLILQNPPPLRELIIGAHGWWNLWLIAGPAAMGVPPELDSIANARRGRAPAMFLLAEQDRTIPLRFQRQIFDAYGGEKRLVIQCGADHVAPLNADEEKQLHEAMDWLLKRPRSAEPATMPSDR